MIRSASFLSLLVLMIITGCDSDPHAPDGFKFPIGDVDKGEITFREFECLTCHEMEGVEDENVVKHVSVPTVKLGGHDRRTKTYAELMTSVINPSHKFTPGYPISAIQKDGKSRMRNYNDVMTVSQLIDLVAFLHSSYEFRKYHRKRRIGDIQDTKNPLHDLIPTIDDKRLRSKAPKEETSEEI